MTAVESTKDRIAAGYTALEEWLNTLSHGVGAALSIAGMVVLISMASLAADVDGWKILSFSIYGACMTLLYVASTLYHGAWSPRWKKAFKVMDHCAIFLLISGTYTPFLLVNMRGPVGWTLFAIVWSLAIGGIALKLIYGHRFKALRVGVYLLMGWMIVFASSELAANLNSTALYLVVAGGITYTVGVIFYLGHRIPYNHAIWHLFVVGGSACHFFAMYYGVLPSAAMG
ncbi:hemolysin III family protein [Marinobacteraceae bacterium S3BR75-40.1]